MTSANAISILEGEQFANAFFTIEKKIGKYLLMNSTVSKYSYFFVA